MAGSHAGQAGTAIDRLAYYTATRLHMNVVVSPASGLRKGSSGVDCIRTWLLISGCHGASPGAGKYNGNTCVICA